MCNFGAREECMEGRRSVSSYLDVETTKDQYRLLNPTPLDCITGYIMEDAVGDRDLKRLPQIRLNFIDGCISSYCSILNSSKSLEYIRQANKLACVLCGLESYRMRERRSRRIGRLRLSKIEGINMKRSRLGKTSTG